MYTFATQEPKTEFSTKSNSCPYVKLKVDDLLAVHFILIVHGIHMNYSGLILYRKQKLLAVLEVERQMLVMGVYRSTRNMMTPLFYFLFFYFLQSMFRQFAHCKILRRSYVSFSFFRIWIWIREIYKYFKIFCCSTQWTLCMELKINDLFTTSFILTIHCIQGNYLRQKMCKNKKNNNKTIKNWNCQLFKGFCVRR